MSAGASKPETLQFCCRTAVEVAAAALSAAQVRAEAAQLRDLILMFCILLLRPKGKGWSRALRLSKHALKPGDGRLRRFHQSSGDRYAYVSSFGNCNGRLGRLGLR